MTLHETTWYARILQSDTYLIHRKTLKYVLHTVTNAFNLSREVTACADTWRKRTISDKRCRDAFRGYGAGTQARQKSCMHISRSTETSSGSCR
jgi:hypothetical protein